MNNSIPSHLLDAIVALSDGKTFARAASALHITQSALSQRIKLLEDLLGITLLIRNRTGSQLTEAASKLVRYCRLKNELEQELLEEISANKNADLSGVIRVAGQS